MAVPAENAQYTFVDYLTSEENERIEIINGSVIMMAPPSRVHQEISGALFAQLYNFLEGKKCRVYAAPFAVRLFENENDMPEHVDTVVEPDISVVCDKSKLDNHGCKGAPDMVVEILSPSSLRHDRLIKPSLYQRAGVREYWIVDPKNESVQVFMLDNSGFLRIHEEYGRKDIARVNVLDGCFIDLEKIFSE